MILLPRGKQIEILTSNLFGKRTHIVSTDQLRIAESIQGMICQY